MTEHDRVMEAVGWIRQRVGATPEVAVVLGSGLGEFAEQLERAVRWRYEEIPHWPMSAVVGHAGELVVGELEGRRIAVLAGRVHLYEGHGPQAVAFPVRVVATLGVKALVLTNAAGGINTGFAQGALMVIDDHLNLTGANPLVGPNDERFGPRFPDMSQVYTPRLRELAHQVAAGQGLTLAHGVYAGLLGPSYETPAEIRYLRAIGADAVGMSTVAEALVASHMKLEVLGISCITNMAAGVLPHPLDHDEVMETARRVKDQFGALLGEVIRRM
jgi:purine-nucleoside phosphorylase